MMTEPTIMCPSCRTEIRLTESLAAPLIAATRAQFELQLSQQAAQILQREQAVRDQQRALEQQVADRVEEQLKSERTRLIAQESRKARLVTAAELETKSRELAEAQEILRTQELKLSEAQNAQAELIRKQRKLDEMQRELELNVERRVSDGLAEARALARREAEEGLKLKVMEKDQTIASMQQKIEELKQRAEQGSQQLQGEVQELELESLLRLKFPFDLVEPVPKGEYGGDALQTVVSNGGTPCGAILWECKRTRNWSDGWLAKLREDQRCAKAEFAGRLRPSMSSMVSGWPIRAPRCPWPRCCGICCCSCAPHGRYRRVSRPRPRWSTSI